jgi:hypothetical protein
MTTAPKLASGERLISLEEAARLLRVSKATLTRRMQSDTCRPGTAIYLTMQQLERLGREFAHLRAVGALSLDEAARLLEKTEETLLQCLESGDLRETGPGTAFFSELDLERFGAREHGIADPISTSDAARAGLVSATSLKTWTRTKRLSSVRIGRRLYVSQSALERELRRISQRERRLQLLHEAGRLLKQQEAADLLGTAVSRLANLKFQGRVRPFRRRWGTGAFYRRREIEGVLKDREMLYEPPPNTLSVTQVAKVLGIPVEGAYYLISSGRLRPAAQRQASPRVVRRGYDPDDVARLKIELEQSALLVTAPRAAEILDVSLTSVARMVKRGMLPATTANGVTRFDPKVLHALKSDPAMAAKLQSAREMSDATRNGPTRSERALPSPRRVAKAKQCLPAEAARTGLRAVLSHARAARILGISEEEVRTLVNRGELRINGRAFVKEDLALLLAQRNGIPDPISVNAAMGITGNALYWVKAGWLRAVRVGRWCFISKAEVESEARKRNRLKARIDLLRKAGRLLTRDETADRLGVSNGWLRTLEKRGALKGIRARRLPVPHFRTKDVERLAESGLPNLRWPAGLLSVEEAAAALGVHAWDVKRMVALGRLPRISASGSSGRWAGFRPEDVERVKAENQRIAQLLSMSEASRVLNLPKETLARLTREGVLVPEAYRGNAPLFDPRVLREFLENDEEVVRPRRS